MYTRREFTEDEKNLSEMIRDKFIEIEQLLDTLPNSREKSLALTHIEDAMLHTNLAIATDVPISG